MDFSYKIFLLSESALVLEWPEKISLTQFRQIAAIDRVLREHPFEGWIEQVPTYAALTIFFDPNRLPQSWDNPIIGIQQYLQEFTPTQDTTVTHTPRIVQIPVCYHSAFSPDLEAVAQARHLTTEQVIALHHQPPYHVFMMGFLPGFAYMGPLAPAIATPRKAIPNTKVAAGSVGIAGHQTGIYPIDSPGGWQIIGRTPLPLFDRQRNSPFLLQAGDTVQFYPISTTVFEQYEKEYAPIQRPSSVHPLPDATVLKPGVRSVFQDMGRFRYRAFGVPVGGALDRVAHCSANALVGNPPDAATIESTMGGLVVQFNRNCTVALTGGAMAWVNQRQVQYHQALSLQKGDILEVRFNQQGLRTYIAVRGGFDCAVWMGSKSVCIQANLGDVLKKGDILSFGKTTSDFCSPKEIFSPCDAFLSKKNIRLIPGPEYAHLTAKSQAQLYAQGFQMTHRCDSMGGMLQSDALILPPRSHEMLSAAVAPGTVQLLPSGQLIVLLNDCQTTGGYPRIGQVAAVDLPLMAQTIPGEILFFNPITIAEATTLFTQQTQQIYALFDRP